MSPIAKPVREAIPEPLRRYLPTRQERGKYTGPLSTFAEYHALGVGFAAGIMGLQYAEPLVAYATGNGAGKIRRSGHLKDAAQELGYTAAGIVAGLAVRHLPGATAVLGSVL